MKKKTRILLAALLLVAAVAVYFAGGGFGQQPDTILPQENNSETQVQQGGELLSPEGVYTSKEEVALYLHQYGVLPSNFITKSEAKELGWDADKGNLWEIAPGMSIGGDRFGNREGLLPKAEGRTWYECDCGYEGGYRGAERILYSDDGLIYYTDDHYETFTQLY